MAMQQINMRTPRGHGTVIGEQPFDPFRRIDGAAIAPQQLRAAPVNRPLGRPLLDPAQVRLADLPSEWQEIPTELLALLAPGVVTKVFGEHLQANYLVDPTGLVTGDQASIIRQLLRQRWFLMQNTGGQFHRAICGLCGRTHDYLTLGCIERPFHGLQEIVGLIETYEAEGKDMTRVATAIRLGSIVPITRRVALGLANRIKAKGIPFYSDRQITQGR